MCLFRWDFRGLYDNNNGPNGIYFTSVATECEETLVAYYLAGLPIIMLPDGD